MSSPDPSKTRQGAAPRDEIDPALIGAGTPAPPGDDDELEVVGRAMVHHAMKCYKCEGVTWINYDTDNYKAYSCSRCGAINVL